MTTARPARAPWSFGHAEVFAGIFALSFLAARFLPVLSLAPACPLKTLAGIPCATCGMTHAFVALAHGHVSAAIAASPAGALLAAGVWAFAAVAAARPVLGFEWPHFAARGARALAVAVGAGLLLNWVYLVARGG